MDVYILGYNQEKQCAQHEEVATVAEMNTTRYR
jgi:hypothetical protein